MMKKVMALSLALVLILGLAAGCGGGTEQTQAPASDAPASEAPASEAPSGTAEYTMSVASADGSGGIAHRACRNLKNMWKNRAEDVLTSLSTWTASWAASGSVGEREAWKHSGNLRRHRQLLRV